MWVTLTSIQILGIGNQCLSLLVGIPLILGMIDFERNGADPMKRNLIDMLYTFGWSSMLTNQLITGPLVIWNIGIGSLNPTLAYVFHFMRMTYKLNLNFLLVEAWILRMSIEWIWKRPPPIQEDFFAIFLPTLNIVIGFWFSWILFLTGERGHHVVNRLVSAHNAVAWPDSDIRLGIDKLIVFLTAMSFVTFLINKLFSPLKSFCSSDATIAVLNPNAANANGNGNDNSSQRWNNQEKNDEFVSTTMQLMVGSFIVVTFVWFHKMFGFFRSLSNDNQFAIFTSVSVVVLVIAPSLIYLKNSNLRRHVLYRVKAFFGL